jgi:hypothetical protein
MIQRLTRFGSYPARRGAPELERVGTCATDVVPITPILATTLGRYRRWENEALREIADSNGELEIVYPPVSIRAEPAVAWVDANDKETDDGVLRQGISRVPVHRLRTGTARQYGYRTVKPEILARHTDRLPNIAPFPITAIAKDWGDAREKFFADNGIFDVVSASAPAAPGASSPRTRGADRHECGCEVLLDHGST